MYGHRLLRVSRAAAFAVVCVTLAAAAHRLGGGAMPRGPVPAAGFAAVFLPSVALAGRERSLRTIAPLLLATQAGLHTLFHATSTAGGHLGTTGHPAAVAHGCVAGSRSGLVMTLAHLWATLVTAWWLARGEALLWALVRLAARVAVRALALPRIPAAPSPLPAAWTPPGARLPRPRNPSRTPVRRRGPPPAGPPAPRPRPA